MLDALLSWDGWTVTQLPAEQAAIFRLEGVPPSEEFLFIQESEALEILFCRKGGLFLEWAGHRRLSLSADQVLFLPVRTEAYRGQFASESFYGTLVRMEAKTAWSTLRAMHSDLGESISRAWNDPCMLRAALWSEALFSALDYMQLGHIGDYYVIKALEVLFLLRLPYPKPDRDHTRDPEIHGGTPGRAVDSSEPVSAVPNFRHSVEVLFPPGLWGPSPPVSSGAAHGPGRGAPHDYDPVRTPDLHGGGLFQRQPIWNRL